MVCQSMQRKKVFSKPTLSTRTTLNRVDDVDNVGRQTKRFLVK
jgi:hypothetical protein